MTLAEARTRRLAARRLLDQGIDPGMAKKGYSRSTIEALAPLAKRHGLDSIAITCPSGNDEARAALLAIGGRQTNSGGQVHRFRIPLD